MKRSSHSACRCPVHRGFTLMEMLIVLGILVMLIALAAPRFLGAQRKADIQAAKTQIGLFRGALERYALDMKTFPATEQGLQALLTAPAESTAAEGQTAAAGNWDGPYLDKTEIPKDPWGNDYQYRYPPERGTGDFPDIWSYGPDGQDNTEDDICSWGTPQAGSGSGQPIEPGAGSFDRPPMTPPPAPGPATPPGGAAPPRRPTDI